MIFDGEQKLGGTGKVVLSDSTTNVIEGNSLLTIGPNLTILGAGKLGANQLGMINQGNILAQGVNTLVIDAGTLGFTNTGKLGASDESGRLVILDTRLTNNGLLHVGATGTLWIKDSTLVNTTSVDLGSGSTLTIDNSNINGVFNAKYATGTIEGTNNIFDNVTYNGEITQSTGSVVTIRNGLTINGRWIMNGSISSAPATRLFFEGKQLLDGSGEVILNDSNANFIEGNGLLAIGPDITLRGSDYIDGQLGLVNQGTLLAQGNNPLIINASVGGVTNNGIMSAEGPGGLSIWGTKLQNNGAIGVTAGSNLNIKDSSIIGGTIDVAAGATGYVTNSVFDGVTVTGDGTISIYDGATLTVRNGLTVNSRLYLEGRDGTYPVSTLTKVVFDGDQALDGAGEVVLNDNESNRIEGNGVLTIGPDISLRGAGHLGAGLPGLINQGTIMAQGTKSLVIDAGLTHFTNNGVLKAEGTGGLRIDAGSFITSGLVEVIAGSKLERMGTFTQTAGNTHVDGSLTATGGLDIQGGSLSGNGTITADVGNAGLVSPGNSPGTLTIHGNFTQSSAGILDIELGGTIAGTEYDVLDITGTAYIDGTLRISLWNGFTPRIGDSFDILLADVIIGSFSVLDLAMAGDYNWQVNYLSDIFGSKDVVRLTMLGTPVPLPTAIWLFMSGLLVFSAFSRRNMRVSLT